MDHFDPLNGEKVAIGLVRIPATHEEYRGPIIINPGTKITNFAEFVQEILKYNFFFRWTWKIRNNVRTCNGRSHSKHCRSRIRHSQLWPSRLHDSYMHLFHSSQSFFSSSGIGASTPKILNHPNDIERAIWRAKDPLLINMSKLPDTLPLLYSRADVFGQLAFHAPSSHAAEHVGSVAVARDMVNITNAFGFDKVKFWGMSYGSTVGGTYEFFLLLSSLFVLVTHLLL